MVKLIGDPVQVTLLLLYDGVTVIVAVTAAPVTLVAVKLGMFPTPPAPSPMDVVLFVQLYTIVPPVVGLLKVTAVVAPLLQTV